MLLVFTQLHRLFLKAARQNVKHAFPQTPHPADTPLDLKDRRPLRNLDKDGNRLTDQIWQGDIGMGPPTIALSIGALAPALVLLSVLLPWQACIVFLFVFTRWLVAKHIVKFSGGDREGKFTSNTSSEVELFPTVCVRTEWMIVVILIAGCFNSAYGEAAQLILIPYLVFGWLKMPFHYFRDQRFRRDKLIQLGQVATADSAGSGASMLERFVDERFEQDIRAAEDKTPLFVIGEATGMLAASGDVFAPDKDRPVAMSLKDLAVHLFAFGTTGTGKTYGVMRQALKFWMNGDNGKSLGGAVVLDGKGDLPREFADIPGFTLISPENKTLTYGVIAGLGAEDVSAILLETMAEKGKKDFWAASAEQLLRNAAFLLEEAGRQRPGQGFGWTLVNLARTLGNDPYRSEVIGAARNPDDDGMTIDLLSLAIQYFEVEFKNMAVETRGGIQQQAMSYLAPIIGHRDLFDWCNTEGGFAIEDVTRGACVGLATPAYKYGNPGMAIQALAKARVYKALRERGSEWQKTAGQTRVMILIDECQMLVGAQDMGIASVARSLGGILVFATQHIEGLREQMGAITANSMLGNFRNLICFSSTEPTHEYMVGRVGATVRRAEGPSIGIDYLKLFKVTPIGHSISGVTDVVESGEKIGCGYSFEIKSAVTADEISAGVAARFHAIVLLNRADAPRRDLTKIIPAY